jgi:hypothetical protein
MLGGPSTHQFHQQDDEAVALGLVGKLLET